MFVKVTPIEEDKPTFVRLTSIQKMEIRNAWKSLPKAQFKSVNIEGETYTHLELTLDEELDVKETPQEIIDQGKEILDH